MSAALANPPAHSTPARPRHAAAPAQPAKSLLRFITCGSVDDGKSTLLGRLLHETGGIFEDQFGALERDSRKFGTTGEDTDFALLVDGLAAEREQGITIDVAYRYFSTPRRSFIAADTPGHEQYTRNMATGASTADLAIILIDARKGVLPQTRRHSFIVSMMGVKHLVLAVNKMDLVDHAQSVFDNIVAEFRSLAASFGKVEIAAIPLSARNGDNVASPSLNMPWYKGPTLLSLLETAEITASAAADFRLPVQWVNRPNSDFRGFAGTITGGEVRPGDAVTVLPARRMATVARIVTQTGDLDVAVAGQSITLTFREEVDVSRGAVIASGALPAVTTTAQATLLVVADARVEPGRSYWLKLGASLVPARIASIAHQIDVHSYEKKPAAALAMNGIGSITLAIETPIAIEAFAANAELGSFILIDRFSNDTVAMGVVTEAGEAPAVEAAQTGESPVTAALRWLTNAGEEDVGPALTRLISWRIISAALLILASLALTGSWFVALAMAAGDLLLRTALKRLHHQLFAGWQKQRASKAAERLSQDGSDI